MTPGLSEAPIAKHRVDGYSQMPDGRSAAMTSTETQAVRGEVIEDIVGVALQTGLSSPHLGTGQSRAIGSLGKLWLDSRPAFWIAFFAFAVLLLPVGWLAPGTMLVKLLKGASLGFGLTLIATVAPWYLLRWRLRYRQRRVIRALRERFVTLRISRAEWEIARHQIRSSDPDLLRYGISDEFDLRAQ